MVQIPTAFIGAEPDSTPQATPVGANSQPDVANRLRHRGHSTEREGDGDEIACPPVACSTLDSMSTGGVPHFSTSYPRHGRGLFTAGGYRRRTLQDRR